MEKKSYSMEHMEICRWESRLIILAKCGEDLAQQVEKALIKEHAVLCSE